MFFFLDFQNGQHSQGTINYVDYVGDDYDEEDEDDGDYISYEELKLQHELETSQKYNESEVILIDEEDDGDESNGIDHNGDNQQDLFDKQHYFFNSNKPHVCKICFKTVANRYNLKRHMMIHTGERPYGCDMCTKRFREFCDLKKHRRVHSCETSYVCMVCYENPPTIADATKCQMCLDKEFENKVTNSSAIQTQFDFTEFGKNKKAYSCPVCDRIFGSLHNLKRHIMIHTGEKPFKCEICSRPFRELGTLRKHQLIHIQPGLAASSTLVDEHDVLYECSMCQKKFMNSSNLNEHIQFAHSELILNIGTNEYRPCPICGRNFRSMQHLQSHMLTHS